MKKDILKIIDPVIQRNAFFAHPENMLLAMAADERLHIRELAYRRIIKAREQNTDKMSVRTFLPPKLNFEASDYTDLIDWSNFPLSPPPSMMSVKNESIQRYLRTKEIPDFEFLMFPCHTQAVERCVKLVTESAGKVCGETSREGYIRSTLLSRSKMPKFEQKSNFKT